LAWLCEKRGTALLRSLNEVYLARIAL
jgi:hypothetical protein